MIEYRFGMPDIISPPLVRGKDLEDLLSNPVTPRFEVAKALARVDSRTLRPEVRHSLGLSPFPSMYIEPKMEEKVPTLVQNGLPRLCTNSEANLKDAFDQIGHPTKAPLLLEGCLLGKKHELVSAVCFQTTEFPNGAVFLKGVWYRPRNGTFQTVQELGQHNADQEEERILSLDLHPDYPKAVSTTGLIVKNKLGGIWEASRDFITGPIRNYGLFDFTDVL